MDYIGDVPYDNRKDERVHTLDDDRILKYHKQNTMRYLKRKWSAYEKLESSSAMQLDARFNRIVWTDAVLKQTFFDQYRKSYKWKRLYWWQSVLDSEELKSAYAAWLS